MPHPTAVWNTRFEADIQVRWLQTGAFDAQGIRPVPSRVFLRKLGTLNAVEMKVAESAVARWFEIKN